MFNFDNFHRGHMKYLYDLPEEPESYQVAEDWKGRPIMNDSDDYYYIIDEEYVQDDEVIDFIRHALFNDDGTLEELIDDYIDYLSERDELNEYLKDKIVAEDLEEHVHYEYEANTPYDWGLVEHD